MALEQREQRLGPGGLFEREFIRGNANAKKQAAVLPKQGELRGLVGRIGEEELRSEGSAKYSRMSMVSPASRTASQAQRAKLEIRSAALGNSSRVQIINS